ncbi:unnamed protein product, partial [Mesorhabditis belari]|uniref:Zinc transporter 1 n=1 Tax=Mesorhabditis belari TaxID=2138241 RepID=A0AAF3J797_9BILA
MAENEERIILLGRVEDNEKVKKKMEQQARKNSATSRNASKDGSLLATPEMNDEMIDEETLPSTSTPLIQCLKHTRREESQPIDEMHEREEENCGEKENDQHRKNSWKVSVMITITFLFFFVELFVGILNKSIALLADSYHMLADVMALIVALVCLRISRRKSKKNGFGWVRAEVLGALANGVFLLSMCFTISLEAFGRILNPLPMSQPLTVLVVGVIGLLINAVGIGMFHGGHGHSHAGGGHGHSHGGNGHSHENGKEEEHNMSNGKKTESPRKVNGPSLEDSDLPPPRVRSERAISQISQLSTGVSHNHLALRLVGMPEEPEDDEDDGEVEVKKERKEQKAVENLNMRGVLLHIMADALGSIFVIITAACSYFFKEQLGVVSQYLDPVLSLALVGIICFSAYNLVAQTADIIMRRPPQFLEIDELKNDITKISGVSACISLDIWTLVGNRHIATAEIEFCSVLAFDQAASKIRRLFHRNGVHSLTIQPSFSETCILEMPQEENPTPEPTKIDVIKRGKQEETASGRVIFDTGAPVE